MEEEQSENLENKEETFPGENSGISAMAGDNYEEEEEGEELYFYLWLNRYD
tara:strand:+ start:355 stop:507 length:153 start_codon:yes stop_codon:yes gene_type:complete